MKGFLFFLLIIGIIFFTPIYYIKLFEWESAFDFWESITKSLKQKIEESSNNLIYKVFIGFVLFFVGLLGCVALTFLLLFPFTLLRVVPLIFYRDEKI